jgi:D-serine deaminase-like pyridoxal phosphate-dependent protein
MPDPALRLRLADIPTPAALVDEARMTRNIARMQERMNALGATLRPHVKTPKCVEVAKRQQAAGARAITVSTLKEAEEFFAAGFIDILYAVCIAPQKLDRVRALRRQGCRLTILVDEADAARAVVAKGKVEPHAFDVMIEVDTDGHRSGVKPDADTLIEIAQILHEGGAALRGVMTHAGSSYELDTPDALARLAEQERAGCVRAAERLRAAGLPCAEVSVGSTPTALSAQSLAGVTEVRAGVYVFFDLVMANVGVCTPRDIALSVLTTVIGHQADKGWAIVDAGWMAMSRDRGRARQRVDYGYGAVCDEAGELIDGFILSGANQEHGILARRDGAVEPDIVARFPIGTLLRVLPNHACATGAQFDRYHALSPDGALRIWPRFHGW